MSRWGGHASRTARTQLAPLVAAGVACCRCSRLIRPGQAWHADHYPISREQGGTQVAAAHARCNTSDGGRRGAQLTNTKRRRRPAQLVTMTTEQHRGIRGV